MSEITHLLAAAQLGDEKTVAQFYALVYSELRKIAGERMHFESTGNTLQATACAK